MIDLYTHSRASDGSLSPSELMRTARERGLTVMDLTDHDTIDGLEEAGRRRPDRDGSFLI
jgi:predicted metal-dependent phosphoesterase TrpH